MKLIIDIPEELYKSYKGRPPMLGDMGMDMIAQAIANGIPLSSSEYQRDVLPKYEAEVITRGNCMMCGKELTEGLFLCKECEDKASSRK